MFPRFRELTLDDEERDFVAGVEKHGWIVMTIKDEPGRASWSYTVGLFENFRHPEVIIFGLKPDSRHRILNWIGENVKKGNPFTADAEHDWVLTDYTCWSRSVQKKWYHDLLGWARWFYRTPDETDNFPCVQAFWPDKNGVFPWQPEYGYADQPLLYEDQLLPARMMHWAADSQLGAEEWPFECDPHTETFLSRCVLEDGKPIVRVVHDFDGSWQFIGPVDDPSADGCKVSCFHCIVERDPSIKFLAGLPVGMAAVRDKLSDQWTWEQMEEEEAGSEG